MRTNIYIFILCLLFVGKAELKAQENEFKGARIAIGGSLSTDLNWGQEGSHYFYNGIHPEKRDWFLGIQEANLRSEFRFHKNFSFLGRLQLRRMWGNDLNEWVLAQAVLRYKSDNNKFRLELGRFLLPIGNFYQNILPQDRLMVSPPLPYAYYVNISDQLGYASGLQEPGRIIYNGRRDWGSNMSYAYGYGNGLKFHWKIIADTLEVDLAISQAAPIASPKLSRAFRPTLMGRIQYHPIYFWTQGFSFSYGGILDNNDETLLLENAGSFRQLLLGTDFKTGFNYFEIGGEIIASRYRVPVFNDSLNQFTPNSPFTNPLWSLGAYADLKVEVPSFPGFYAAYRLGFIHFNRMENGGSRWDDPLRRHSVALAYRINHFLILKSVYSWQRVSNQDWPLDHWRTNLTIHF
ncbi:MAG: hypothetical protein R8P61_37590 [Bacteroidia bacterium]|nr:hypothetical protein [Bacteroidia bacterium]